MLHVPVHAAKLKRRENATHGACLRSQIQLCHQLLRCHCYGILTIFPFNVNAHHVLDKKYTMCRGRLTHVQVLFPWNPAPLQLSKITFEYLLLPPRYAAASCFYQVHTTCISTISSIILLAVEISTSQSAWHQTLTLAPSIFGASSFGRWVVTHSLANSDFHDHRPAVHMSQHPLWYLLSGIRSAH